MQTNSLNVLEQNLKSKIHFYSSKLSRSVSNFKSDNCPKDPHNLNHYENHPHEV